MQKLKGEDTLAHKQAVAGGDPLMLFCLADGHGGPVAAEWVATQLLDLIVANLKNGSEDSLRQALRLSFVEAHESIKKVTLTAGCTCSVVAVNVLAHFVVSANVGDSLALLTVSHGDDVALTGDHRIASNDAERASVERRGAVVARAANANASSILLPTASLWAALL